MSVLQIEIWLKGKRQLMSCTQEEVMSNWHSMCSRSRQIRTSCVARKDFSNKILWRVQYEFVILSSSDQLFMELSVRALFPWVTLWTGSTDNIFLRLYKFIRSTRNIFMHKAKCHLSSASILYFFMDSRSYGVIFCWWMLKSEHYSR